ncbi:DUF6220 domain-containing protein [Paenibacillus solisilvae]|uniref:DUF6220 domain-containing protein n=1 Tax=Paenibacillus solisilvae TaxID=2486751 RepID=A0ABW0VZ70_9BACL
MFNRGSTAAAETEDNFTESQDKPAGLGYIRFIILLLAGLFLISVMIQVFLAGMASLVNASHWQEHRSFIHYFEIIPVGIFVLSFIGHVRGAVRWLGLMMILFIGLQYMTANMASRLPALGALHPVLALFLFWISIVAVQKAYFAWRNGVRSD